MSTLRFVQLIAADIDLHKVVQSKFATAGHYHKAVGEDCFAVFDDRNGDRIEFESSMGAAFAWHKINLGALHDERKKARRV